MIFYADFLMSRCRVSTTLPRARSTERYVFTTTSTTNAYPSLLFNQVLDRERRGDYLGKTVQIVPHATDMIISWIKDVSKRPVDGSGATPDVCLIEVRQCHSYVKYI
jgi:CTP synthase (UTP-ammonia lyase)